MKTLKSVVGVCLCVGLTSCAHIDFDGKGLLYFEPVPYLLVATAADCSRTVNLLMLPGQRKYLRFVNGYGSADLTATLGNGMISVVGQNVDNKVAETITSLAALRTAIVATRSDVQRESCVPAAALYPVVDGKPDSAPVWKF